MLGVRLMNFLTGVILNIHKFNTMKKYIVIQFFIIMFKLMIFTFKSKTHEKWYTVASGIMIWLNLFVMAYAIIDLFK